MLVIERAGAAFWWCVLFGIGIDVCGWSEGAIGEFCLLVVEESFQRDCDYGRPRSDWTDAVGK